MTTTKADIKNLSCYLQQASSLFLFANLPFYFNNIQRWSIIAFIFFSVIDIIVNQRWKNINYRSPSAILCYLLIFQYLLILLYIPFERTTTHIGMIIEYRLSLLLFGLVGLFYTKRSINIKYYAYVAIAVTSYIAIYVLCNVGLNNLQDFDTFKQLFTEYRHHHIQAHMATNTFFRATMLLSAYMVKQMVRLWKKLLFTLPIILSYLLMIFSDGRIGLIGANLIVLAIIIYFLREYKIALLSLLSLVIILSITTITLHPKTSQTFDTNKNPRVWIWKIALEKIKAKPITGYGVNTAQEEMRSGMLSSDEFMSVNDEFLISFLRNPDELLGAHPHNQILQSILEFGVIGIVVISAILLLPIYILKQKHNSLLPIIFWVIIIMQLFTETIHTSMGEVAFCLYLILLIQLPEQVSPDDSAEQ